MVLFRVLGFSLCLIGCFTTQAQTYKAELVIDGLEYPWSIAFLPNGDAFITEKPGRLRYFKNKKLLPEPITGLPKVKYRGQGGLMGVALHPAFSDNKKLCFSYVGSDKAGTSTQVSCGVFTGQRLDDVETIFVAEPRSSRAKHFGGQLAFDEANTLYLTLGDRGERQSAQNNLKHNGSLIRITPDGSAVQGNPFVGSDDGLAEIFSTGHRNMQGIAIHPVSKQIWTHEHGPQGGDEVNINHAGKNYGWPIITYGVNYGFGTKIGEGTAKPGLEQPVHKWVPSIAPAGMMFYSGSRYPDWKNHLFVGSLKFGELVRLQFDGEKLIDETRYFDGAYGGIRLSLIHISEPTRLDLASRMPSSA